MEQRESTGAARRGSALKDLRRRRRQASAPATAAGLRSGAHARLVGGRYRLLRRLGMGASAEVWRARDERTGDQVAVKLLHPWLLEDPHARLRLESEAKAGARLRHPAIVAVRDVVLDDTEAAIVMDLVPGGTLADRLRSVGPLPDRRAAGVALDLAAALAEAHRAGVVHRDVKPGNVLLDADDRPHLADFGIARSLDDPEGLTVTGTVMGSLRYMAPEQLAGDPPGPAADVFALGAVLYEMLAGRPAFDARSPGELIEQQHREPPPVPGADRALAAIALAALRRDPERRTATAAGFGRALRAWLDGLPPVVPDAAGSGVATAPIPVLRPTAPIVSARRWATVRALEARGAIRGRARIGLALSAIGLALAGAAIASGWTELGAPAPRAPVAGLIGNAPLQASPAASPAASPRTAKPSAATSARPAPLVSAVRAAKPEPSPSRNRGGHGRDHGHDGSGGPGDG